MLLHTPELNQTSDVLAYDYIDEFTAQILLTFLYHLSQLAIDLGNVFFLATVSVRAELMNVNFCRLANTGVESIGECC